MISIIPYIINKKYKKNYKKTIDHIKVEWYIITCP